MRFLSLFSGIGGFDLGLERAGMECVGQCDNDPFCNKVLAKRWPNTARWMDVRDISVGSGNSQQLAYMREQFFGSPDLICGGFPCQDLSVAGKRAGLDGDRSSLWFEFKRILSELRPRWALIENVPGLLSSNEGRDFAVLLAGLEQCGFGGISWAVLDSQFFGVPQRRRRVYVVAGPSRRCTEQVLSICEGGDWHPPTRRETGEDVAYALSASVRGTGDGHGNAWNTSYVANTLRGQPNASHRSDTDTYIAHTLSADGFDASEDGTGRGTPLVSVRTAQTGSNGWGVNEDGTAYTLDGTQGQAVAGASVRRLTPVECERLQGFPDDWTKVDAKTPDGPRYKACGNAVSVPVIEYLGLRIMAIATQLRAHIAAQEGK